MDQITQLKNEIKMKILRKIEERLAELPAKSYDEMTYDELYNEIIYNRDDPDILTLIAEGIRFNKNLTEIEKDELWSLIERLTSSPP